MTRATREPLVPIDVEIVSPERRLLARAVDMAVVPGSEGDLAAMPDHAPMIVLLRGGVVSLHQGDQVHRPLLRPPAALPRSRPSAAPSSPTARCRWTQLSPQDGEARLRDAERAYDQADKSDVPAWSRSWTAFSPPAPGSRPRKRADPRAPRLSGHLETSILETTPDRPATPAGPPTRAAGENPWSGVTKRKRSPASSSSRAAAARTRCCWNGWPTTAPATAARSA